MEKVNVGPMNEKEKKEYIHYISKAEEYDEKIKQNAKIYEKKK